MTLFSCSVSARRDADSCVSVCAPFNCYILSPPLDYCEKCGYKHGCINLSQVSTQKRIPGSCSSSVFILRTSRLFPTAAAPFDIPTCNAAGLGFPTSSQHASFSVLLRVAVWWVRGGPPLVVFTPSYLYSLQFLGLGERGEAGLLPQREPSVHKGHGHGVSEWSGLLTAAHGHR